MAVANRLSNLVTNADAAVQDTPPSLGPVIIGGGKLKTQAATVETAAADDAGSVYRLFRVHSSWRISRLLVGHDAVTNMSTADIGVYDTAESGGAVIDVDFFASAIDISSASSGLVDRTYEAANTNIANIEQDLYTQLGLTAHKWMDIAVTATTNDPTAAATISAILEYVDASR